MKIFLVDDNPMFLAATAAYLKDFPNVEVVGMAYSAFEAMEMLPGSDAELVLMDIDMPDLDGLAATVFIKSQPNAPRVMLVTSHHDLKHRIRAGQVGADGFISKDKFLTEIRPLLDSASSISTTQSRPAIAA